MPRDLFASVRPPSRRRFRRTVTILSIVGHVAILAVLLVAQVLAVGPLPDPRFPAFDFIATRIADIELPPPAPRPAPRQPIQAVDESASLAPIVAPTGIKEEVRTELPPEPAGSVVGIRDRATDLIGNVTSVAPPPSALAPVQPVHLHSGIQAPRKVADARPDYPALARAARVEGIVIIEATIGATGNVEDARVLRSIPMLDQTALDAVRQWKYTPALLNGVPIPVIITVTVSFRLQ